MYNDGRGQLVFKRSHYDNYTQIGLIRCEFNPRRRKWPRNDPIRSDRRASSLIWTYDSPALYITAALKKKKKHKS